MTQKELDMTAKEFLKILRTVCARSKKCSECVFGVFCGEDPRNMTEAAMDGLIRIAEECGILKNPFEEDKE